MLPAMRRRFLKAVLLVAACLGLPSAVVGQPGQAPTNAPAMMAASNSTPSVAIEASNSTVSAPLANPTLSLVPSPSLAPTNSLRPTNAPSAEPTVVPTPIPPTEAPSEMPSLAPSTLMPTAVCHDNAAYRSSLNMLQCKDHAGTDCFEWQSLGLTPDQVEELITSCPVSCDIACGSLLKFEVEISFVLENVDNYLEPDSKEALEQVSSDFMTRYIRPMSPASHFNLYSVELLSQSPVDDNDEDEEPDAATEEQIDLAVTIAFRGFALDLNSTTVEQYLASAIVDLAYARALRLTGDWSFRNVQVSGSVETTIDPIDEPSPQSMVDDDGSLSPGAIFASVFAALVIASFGGGFLVLQRKRKRERLDLHPNFDKDDFDSLRLSSPGGSTRSPLANVLSFESVLRLMTSASDASHRSASPTSEEGSVTDQQSRQSKDVTSPTSDDSFDIVEEEDEEHPYAALIPPMIVYDNIDGDEELGIMSETPNKEKRFKNVVPSMQVSATKRFAASLRDGSGATLTQESTYEHILQNIGRQQPQTPVAASHQVDNDEENAEAPFSVSKNSSFEINRSFRKTLSDSCLGVRSTSPDGSPEKLETGVRDQSSVAPGLQSSTHSSPVPTRTHKPSSSMDGLMSGATIGAESAKEKVEDQSWKSIWTFPPVKAWKTSPPTPGSSKSPAPPGRSSSPMPRGRSRSPAISPEKTARFSRRRSSPSSDSGIGNRLPSFGGDDDGRQLVFQASRKGKLGLVIQCLDDLGPVVTQVKDYSPLLGQVLPGDRIVDIDGISTSGMTLRDVTGMMGGKVAQKSRWASVFRIVVWRKHDELLEHSDFSSSASSALLLSDSPVASQRHTSARMATPPRGRSAPPPPPPPPLPSSLLQPTLTSTPPQSRTRSSSLSRSVRSEDSDPQRRFT